MKQMCVYPAPGLRNRKESIETNKQTNKHDFCLILKAIVFP